MGKDRVIFHRYFEGQDLKTCGQLGIFTDNEEKGLEREDDAVEEDGKWENTRSYDFELAEDGVLTFTFPEESHSIRIFPVRKDLLDSKFFKV